MQFELGTVEYEVCNIQSELMQVGCASCTVELANLPSPSPSTRNPSCVCHSDQYPCSNQEKERQREVASYFNG